MNPIAPEKIWQTWKENFGTWAEKYYGTLWEQTFSDNELTQGVLEPFTLTGLAPALGCRVRFLQGSKKIGEEKDAVLMDELAGTELAHIEYENFLKNCQTEIPKLSKSKANIKCLITFGFGEMNRNLEGLEEEMKYILDPVIFNALSLNEAQEWLLIFGANLDLNSPSHWVAYKYSRKDGQNFKTKLT